MTVDLFRRIVEVLRCSAHELLFGAEYEAARGDHAATVGAAIMQAGAAVVREAPLQKAASAKPRKAR